MIKIKIKGISKLIKKFNGIPPRLKEHIHIALKKSAFLVESQAKPITPFDTGRLRGSIRVDLYPYKAIIGPHVYYAIFVHEGTRRWPLSVPPKKPGTVRQFMKIGAEKSVSRIQDIFNIEIKKSLE